MVAALEPSLPCKWLMFEEINLKVIVVILGSPPILTVSSQLQECSKMRPTAKLIKTLSLKIAKLPVLKTIQKKLDLLLTSHLWL